MFSNKISIVRKTENPDYHQYDQHTNLMFSTVSYENNEYVENEYPFMCREFFVDILLATKLDMEMEKSYNMKAVPMQILDGTFMILLSTDCPDVCISNFITYINNIEDGLSIKRTEVYVVAEGDGYALKMDEYWASSPLLLSTYTYLVRLCMYHPHVISVNTLLSGKADVNVHEDVETLDSIGYSNFDMDFFLLNSREIIKKNPFTGIDDDSLKNIYELGDNESINYSKKPKVYIYRETLHSNIGLSRFLDTLENVAYPSTRYSLTSDWARAYQRLVS